MKTFTIAELLELNSADKKPEKYIGPDGKPKIRMVPVDKNVTNEISKGMVGRYLKKVPGSSADAGRDSVVGSGKVKQGVKKVVKRYKGTGMAVDKLTGKAKVLATEEKHVFRFTTKTKQGNHHHDSKDHAGAAKSIEKKTGEKVTSMTYKGKKEANEPSDAVKAFLAKGGKIKKLPPAKAQGYHGKDDPGKHMHGMMDKPDTKAMGTRKKVKSMENKTFFELRDQLNEGKYVGGPRHTHPQHIGANNSPQANKIKVALTKAGHSFKDHGDLPANKKMNKHYISMKDKEGHAALMKLKKTHMNEDA
jgi:hypothetical protein